MKYRVALQINYGRAARRSLRNTLKLKIKKRDLWVSNRFAMRPFLQEVVRCALRTPVPRRSRPSLRQSSKQGCVMRSPQRSKSIHELI